MKAKKKHLSNVLWMSFADFGLAFTFWMLFFNPSMDDGSIPCLVLGISNYFFSLATRGWYFIITMNLFSALHKSAIEKLMKRQCILHLYVWGSSGILVLIPMRHYVPYPGGECWIDTKAWVLTIPEYILSMMYLIFAIALLICMVSVLKTEVDKIGTKSILFRTVVFVLIYVITWFPYLLFNSFIQFFQCADWCDGVGTILTASNGILNFIVWFFFLPEVRKAATNFIGIDDLPTFTPEQSTTDKKLINVMNDHRNNIDNYALMV